MVDKYKMDQIIHSLQEPSKSPDSYENPEKDIIQFRYWKTGVKNKYFTSKLPIKTPFRIKESATALDLILVIIETTNLYSEDERIKNKLKEQLSALDRASELVNKAYEYGIIPRELRNNASRAHITNYVAGHRKPKINPVEGITLEYVQLIEALGDELYNQKDAIQSGDYTDYYNDYVKIEVLDPSRGDIGVQNNIAITITAPSHGEKADRVLNALRTYRTSNPPPVSTPKVQRSKSAPYF